MCVKKQKKKKRKRNVCEKEKINNKKSVSFHKTKKKSDIKENYKRRKLGINETQ
jgi:hypothetical protein